MTLAQKYFAMLCIKKLNHYNIIIEKIREFK